MMMMTMFVITVLCYVNSLSFKNTRYFSWSLFMCCVRPMKCCVLCVQFGGRCIDGPVQHLPSDPAESGTGLGLLRSTAAGEWYDQTRCLLLCRAPMGVRSAKSRHQSLEWTILIHANCFIQGEVVGFQVLLDSLHPRNTRHPCGLLQFSKGDVHPMCITLTL